MKTSAVILSTIVISICSSTVVAAPTKTCSANGKLKIFILSGQSNMVGFGQLKGEIGTMEAYVKSNPKDYGHLVGKDSKTVKEYYERLRYQAKFLNFAPAMTISALTGQRVQKIFKQVDEIYEQYARRITTGQLNRFLERAIEKNEPSLHRGKRIKFYYAAQISTQPPTIVCFVNYPQAVHFSYKRYLINQFREETGLDKTPIRIIFRQREGRKKKGKTSK